MAWTFGSACDIGGRSEQQDRVAILHTTDGKRHLLVLADGMGGLPDGALAAQKLIDQATSSLALAPSRKAFELLQDICLSTHAALRQLASDTGKVPGTTAVLLYLEKNTASWLHVGDSRLYHFRNGTLANCTNDHSMRRLMLEGGLVTEGSHEAAAAQSSLYMRLGSETVPEPDFNVCKLQAGDVFLLCSDGLWQAIDAEEMLSILAEHPIDQGGPRQLIELARQRSGEGCDNISVAVAQSQATGYWQRLKQLKSW